MGEVTYVVDKHITDRAEAAAVCNAALDTFGPRLASATVDAHSDHDEQMTLTVREAQRKLLVMGREQGLRDPGVGVLVDLGDPSAWALLRTFAPWSIDVELWDAESNSVASFHDCAHSVVVGLSDDDASALASRLSPIAPLLPLSAVHARRRAERDGLRWDSLHRVGARLRQMLRR